MTVAGRIAIGALAVLGVLVIVAAVSWLVVARNPGPPTAVTTPAPFALLTAPIADGPGAATVRRGRYLATAGDCVSCHTRAGGVPFAGGLGLATPFGTIYSPNITGDRTSGVGAWTTGQFYAAMAHGIGRHGEHLYPAFPYTYFNLVPRADSDAILAYLKTLPAVRAEPPANRLPIPLNIRAVLVGWNALFFRPANFVPRPERSAMWNRGAYLVEGLGHCGGCHTPKNFAGADRADRRFQGGALDFWVAPDLTGNSRTGLGRWSAADIAEYLKTGRNARANAAGSMAEVVAWSTSLLGDDDRTAIAVYLKTIPPGPDIVVAAPDAAAMRRGAAVFSDACASCHLADGRGQPRLFPPIGGSASTQQADPTSVLHVILAGGRTAPTLTRPTAITMPSFAWKLTDAEAADVATFVRNSWGNRAAPVAARAAAKLRRALALTAAPTDDFTAMDRR